MGMTARQLPFRVLAGAICLAASLSASAITWHVERDGSGDFTTIQGAAAAASPGDTILLGPGHYTEFTPSSGSGTLLNYYIFLEDDNVTVRGVDRNLVTVGPSLASGYDSKAIGFVNAVVGASITVEGITFAHCIHAITTNETHVTIRDCSFRSNDVGLNSNATVNVLVEDCEFIANSNVGVLQFDAATTPLLIVRNCVFTDNSYGIDSQEENNLVENCTFTGSPGAAIQYSARAVGQIRNCSFEDNNVGIRLSSQTVAQLFDNQISGGGINLGLSNGSSATGSGNIFSGAAFATIDFTGQATASMSNNHILLGTSDARVKVRSTSGPGHTIDLRNNYWGTASAAEIAASILDSQDNPTPIGTVTGTVLFEPFLELPVSTEAISFGELKRLFFGEQ